MESEKEIKLEIRKSEELNTNQNIKLIMRRPDNAVLGKKIKMDIQILDETDPQCIFGNIKTPDNKKSDKNDNYPSKGNNDFNPKPPNSDQDFPILPPSRPGLEEGSRKGGGENKGNNYFVPPSLDPGFESGGAKSPGSYNPVDKEAARELVRITPFCSFILTLREQSI